MLVYSKKKQLPDGTWEVLIERDMLVTSTPNGRKELHRSSYLTEKAADSAIRLQRFNYQTQRPMRHENCCCCHASPFT